MERADATGGTDVAGRHRGDVAGPDGRRLHLDSFNDAGTAATVFAVGFPHTGTVFDEGMWAPSTPLPVASAAQATRRASSAGAASGAGVGAAQQAIKHD